MRLGRGVFFLLLRVGGGLPRGREGMWWRDDVPIYLVVFKEGDGGVAVVGLEFGRDPVGGVDALDIVASCCCCGCVYG